VKGKTGQDGFTLLEVLISMAILAICLTIILQLFSGALRSAGISRHYVRAVLKAREKMETILMFPQLYETEYSGEDDDGFRWTLTVRRERDGEDEDEEGGSDRETSPLQRALTMFRIDVTVRWGEGSAARSFSLTTLKAAKEASPEGDEPTLVPAGGPGEDR
jgi:general secretion pathway protein I